MRKIEICMASLIVSAAVWADVKPASAGMAVDGRLDEPCWKAVDWNGGFQEVAGRKRGGEADLTSFAIVADAHAIYIGVRCKEPELAKIKALPADNIWNCDGFEIFLAPTGKSFSFYHFVVPQNPINGTATLFASEGGNIHPDPYGAPWKVARTEGTDEWTAEIEIPFASFYMTRNEEWSTTWLVNIARTRRAKDYQWTTWSPLEKGFLEPERFRTVKGFPKRAAADDLAMTDVTSEIAARSDGRLTGRLRVKAFALVPGDYTLGCSSGTTAKVSLKTGWNKVSVPCAYPANGRYRTELTLTRDATGERYSRTFPVLVDFDEIRVKLTTPQYRDNFYPGQDSSKIVGSVKTAGAGAVKLTLEGPGIPRVEKTLAAAGDFAFETPGFDFGTATLTVGFGGVTKKVPIRKLAKTGRQMSWIENGHLVVDGKPVFRRNLYGWRYMAGRAFDARIDADKDLFLTPEIVQGSSLEPFRVIKDLEMREAKRDIVPCKEYFEKVTRMIESQKDRDFTCWYISDEPECRGVSPIYLRHIYEFMKKNDPYHVILTSSRAGLTYIDCADWFETHPYPNPSTDAKGERRYGTPINVVGSFVDAYEPEKHPDKCVGTVPQLFSYKFQSLSNEYPTFDEYNSHVWAGLLRGAKSINPFIYTDMGDRPALYEGNRFVFSSIARLEDLLLDAKRTTLLKTDEAECVRWDLPSGDGMFAVVNFTGAEKTVAISGLDGDYKPFRSDKAKDFHCSPSPSTFTLSPFGVVIGTRKTRDAGLPTYDETVVLVARQEYERSHRDNQFLEKYGELAGHWTSSFKLIDGVRDVRAWGNRWAKSHDFDFAFLDRPIRFSKVRLYGTEVAAVKVSVRRNGEWQPLTPKSERREGLMTELDFGETLKTVKLRVTAVHAAPNKTNMEVYEIEVPHVVGDEAVTDEVWLDEPGLWERLSSFHSCPHVTNRWTVASGDVLGHCVIGCTDNALIIGLNGNAERFETRVAQKNATSPSVVRFRIWREDELVWTSPEIASNTPPVAASVDLRGARWMKLEMKGLVEPDLGWAIWGDAKFTMKEGTRPTDVAGLSRQLGILTPPPADAPRINAPTVFGARPGNPVRFHVPVVGKGDIDSAVDGLNAPALKGLHFDRTMRLLTGVVRERGDYPLVIRAKNAFGTAEKRLTLKIGEKIALTPPLGWNSWNAYAMGIDGAKVRETADNLVKLGLVDHGWSYLTIDDGWQMRRRHLPADKCRTPDGGIIVNDKFGDMKALADYVHARGLKFGIYSSPGVTTCCGYEGSWRHEFQDAKTYADWGVDYLKYDWCSYSKVAFGEEPERNQYPYVLMGRALRASGRDIVLSICQYGNENVSAWGAAVGGQCWRTTKDKFDFWNDALSCIEHQADLWRYVGPGAWNDPDMMLVGRTIWSVWDRFDGTRLTPNEQYTHVSMWSMMCAPMMIGCDLAAMDEFTLSLLTNDEVIELNQDELGAAAAPVDKDDAFWYWAKPMSDGSIAVALVNLSPLEHEGKFCFIRQGMTGKWRVRDVWRQADEGVFEKCFRAFVPGHATKLIRLWPTEGAGFANGIVDIRENFWTRKIEKVRSVVSDGIEGAERRDCPKCPKAVWMSAAAMGAALGASAAVDVDGLIARMTVEEKVGQLVQVGASKVLAFDPTKKNDVDFTGPISRGEVGALLFCADARQYNAAQKAAQASRLKIPLLVGIDAVHGCDTVYPIPLAEACSWDEDLWRRTAEATALECRLNGFNWTFAPMIDIARDARWGRIAESAGADPLVASRFAAAKVRGFQGENPADGRHVLACPKHFAAYGMAEGGRDYNLVEVSDATLRDVILPPFRAAFNAGALTVMSGFHTVNGEPCSTSRALLTDVLRGEMGFTGFVVSDCNAIHQCGPRMHGVAADDADAAVQALVAGVDMDMNSDAYRKTLVESVKKGLVPQVTLDAAVRRILLAKRALGLFENPYIDLEATKRAVDVKANLALAREAAGKSVVLLKNEGGLLPLKPGMKVALVGDLARNRDEMSGCWYAFYRHTENATLEEGLKADGVTVVAAEDEADVVIGAFGESRCSNGENNSRASLALPPEQLREVLRLKASGKPFVAVLFNGRPLAVPELAEAADALIEAWNPGSCAGWGLADVITGAVNPSAKLVVDFPHTTGESPAYYATPPTGRPGDPKKRWSTRYIDAPSPSRMLFPFGFGLSYTTFAYANESIRREGDELVLEADVTNTGKVSGREIVQAYTHLVVGRTSRPRRELKGFAAVTLAPGETRRVSIRVPLSALSYHVGKTKVAATGEIEAWIAPDSVSGRKISFNYIHVNQGE